MCSYGTNHIIPRYDVDRVLTTDKLNHWLTQPPYSDHPIHYIPNQISGTIDFPKTHSLKPRLLKQAIEECRVAKSPTEVAMIKHANDISSAAHQAVMEAAKHATNERELHALFIKLCMERGCDNQAYSSIVASGTAAATLHYVKNNAPLAGKLNILLDAGGEWDCYAADITRTFPINGKFTKESRDIYEIVLQMQKETMAMIKADADWDAIHTHAHRVAIDGLLRLGILRGGNATELLDSRASVAFFPHGLGHYLGMDTHDTGGHPRYDDPDAMFRYLRVRGPLKEGSVITVEPGVYFCRFIIDPVLCDESRARYIDAAVLERYWDVGGVRIEDNVLVTKGGCENLTSAPKEVDEIERLMAEA